MPRYMLIKALPEPTADAMVKVINKRFNAFYPVGVVISIGLDGYVDSAKYKDYITLKEIRECFVCIP